MRRFSLKKYILLSLFLFSILSIPPLFIENVRAKTVSTFAPLWKGVSKLKAPFTAKMTKITEEKKRLEVENHLLRLEVKRLKNMVAAKESGKSILPAQVIYRDPYNWRSSVWINVGEESNRSFKCQVIGKNSPVLAGNAVVGLIDFVGKHYSRVRLITDPGCKPSVRAMRGKIQNLETIEHIDALCRALRVKEDTRKSELYATLRDLKTNLSNKSEEWYLAKGILCGSVHPFWKSKGILLKGSGFNYDFADELGGARDLITGKTEIAPANAEKIALIKVGDILVTTGMDGVFPAGLKVAEVTQVFPLATGAYTYDIIAKPIVYNLDDLQNVFVIPSLGFDGGKS